MVLLPIGADQPLNAARCEDIRVARVLNALEATREEIRDAARAVLSDPLFRQNAQRVQVEIAALPGPEHGIRLVERIAA
jgi:UDP:flavonoid glycosyltransferase YjiC (YdhE family)